ncbi:hypothetical protein [Pectobacterium carotovorum]|uniref:hypothetical protein n=1 Tax=Pectobacterium carotovorum TaxID=554 RepID=UPI0021C4BA53|nr:hypothetical protein [Pectobacterium carotovorum]
MAFVIRIFYDAALSVTLRAVADATLKISPVSVSSRLSPLSPRAKCKQFVSCFAIPVFAVGQFFGWL